MKEKYTSYRDAAVSADQHAQLDSLLRRCIQCGLCLPTCATYLATGSEVQSPRGRLLLLGELLALSDREAVQEGDQPASFRYQWHLQSLWEAFDLCLGCRACETSCPSGVSYELLENGKQLAARRLKRDRQWLTGQLGSRGRMRHLRRLAAGARSLLTSTVGGDWRLRIETAPGWLRRWGRRLGTMPSEPDSTRELVSLVEGLVARSVRSVPTAGTDGAEQALATAEIPPEAVSLSMAATPPTVAFFRGCVNDTLLPGAATRMRALLVAAGCRIIEPRGMRCCGAVDRHTGRTARADRLREANLASLATCTDSWDVLAVEAAGCGLELKSYPAEVASRVQDAMVLLAALQLPQARPVPLRVAVHDPCHARHGQGIVDEPRQLLHRIPSLTVLEPDEPEVCCGSGGAFSLVHPELSARMGRRKARRLAATGADLVVTTNAGCLGQIADALALEAPDLPILSLSDLLWYAHLGASWS